MKTLEKEWRRILNTPFLVGDKVRVKDIVILDLEDYPDAGILVLPEETLKVVEIRDKEVIVEDEGGHRLVAELEVLVREDEENKEDVE